MDKFHRENFVFIVFGDMRRMKREKEECNQCEAVNHE
jgi:hypothetical protein